MWLILSTHLVVSALFVVPDRASSGRKLLVLAWVSTWLFLWALACGGKKGESHDVWTRQDTDAEVWEQGDISGIDGPSETFDAIEAAVDEVSSPASDEGDEDEEREGPKCLGDGEPLSRLHVNDNIDAWKLPLLRPRGLAWDGERLWIADYASGEVYTAAPGDPLCLRKVATLDDVPRDMTWDGEYLYTIGWGKVARFSTKQGLDLLREWERPDEFHHMHGIAWGGEHLWTAHVTDQIYEHLLDDQLSIVKVLKNPDNMGGMTFVGDNLWVLSTSYATVTELNPSGEQAVTLGLYQTPSPAPTGIAWDGQDFFVTDESTRMLYRVHEWNEAQSDPWDILPEDASDLSPFPKTVAQDTVLTASESPYLLNTVATVEQGAVLTLEPGVVVFATQGAMLDVFGRFVAVGTPSDPIVFTHASLGASWDGIYFNPAEDQGEPSRVEFCRIQYGNLGFTGSPPITRYNVFWRKSGIAGGIVGSLDRDLVIEGNFFSHSPGPSIWIEEGAVMTGDIVVRSNHLAYPEGAIDISSFGEMDGEVFVAHNWIQVMFNIAISINSMPRFHVRDNVVLLADSGAGMTQTTSGLQQEFTRNYLADVHFFGFPVFFTEGAGGEVSVEENTVVRAGLVSAIQEAGPSNPSLLFHHNNFVETGIFGNDAGLLVDATMNWWGGKTDKEVQCADGSDPCEAGPTKLLPTLDEPYPIAYVVGYVMDGAGQPAVGATVGVTGDNTTTTVAADGSVAMAVAAGPVTLTVTYAQEDGPGPQVVFDAAAATLYKCTLSAKDASCEPSQ